MSIPRLSWLSRQTSIKCDFGLRETEIQAVLNIVDNVDKRIAAGVNLFKEKVRIASLDDNRPDVVICAIPFAIEEYCGISERTCGVGVP